MQRLQGIMMYPSTAEMSSNHIVRLRNCLITQANVLAAEKILGPSIAALKGKTVDRAAPMAQQMS